MRTECNLAISECNYIKITLKSMYLQINYILRKIVNDIIGKIHEKWIYDHLPRSLMQATLTMFVIV